jgi:hypothetical protein
MASIERYQNASGQTRYAVRYRTPQQRQTRRRGFRTKREADLFAATVEVSKARGEYISTSAGRTTIGELGAEWLSRQRGHLKPSSYIVMETAWRVWVKPRWGDVAVGKINQPPCSSGSQPWARAAMT